jgi:hypothetical protein
VNMELTDSLRRTWPSQRFWSCICPFSGIEDTEIYVALIRQLIELNPHTFSGQKYLPSNSSRSDRYCRTFAAQANISPKTRKCAHPAHTHG